MVSRLFAYFIYHGIHYNEYIGMGKVPDYRPPPNTDPLSYLSNYKIYQKIIYTRTVSNLMKNKNKYFVFKNM